MRDEYLTSFGIDFTAINAILEVCTHYFHAKYYLLMYIND